MPFTQKMRLTPSWTWPAKELAVQGSRYLEKDKN